MLAQVYAPSPKGAGGDSQKGKTMSKHNSFSIVNGNIVEADSGSPIVNVSAIGGYDVAAELVRCANVMPDLLAACEAMLAADGRDLSDLSVAEEDAIMLARAAIAKAKGKA